MPAMMKSVVWLLRIGVAFAFAYAAIAGFINPTAWVGFFPPFLKELAPANVVVGVWGVLEMLLALALLFVQRVFVPATIAAVLLLGITVFNVGAFDIVFRDVSIALAAIALALLSREKTTND